MMSLVGFPIGLVCTISQLFSLDKSRSLGQSHLTRKLFDHELISATHGRSGEAAANRNYYAAAGDPKMLWELPDVGHVGGLFAKPEEYTARVMGFVDQSLQEERPIS